MKPGCILVVDDNFINSKLVADVLAYEGHEIHIARDAESARKALAGALPDLILMDIALPGTDGLTLTRQLRQNPLTRDLRIVALTAFTTNEDMRKAMDAGCDGYITKPIDTRSLPMAVARFLALRQPAGVTPARKTRTAGG